MEISEPSKPNMCRKQSERQGNSETQDMLGSVLATGLGQGPPLMLSRSVCDGPT